MVTLEIIVVSTIRMAKIKFAVTFLGIEFVDAVLVVVNDLHNLTDLSIDCNDRDLTMSEADDMIVFVPGFQFRPFR